MSIPTSPAVGSSNDIIRITHIPDHTAGLQRNRFQTYGVRRLADEQADYHGATHEVKVHVNQFRHADAHPAGTAIQYAFNLSEAMSASNDRVIGIRPTAYQVHQFFYAKGDPSFNDVKVSWGDSKTGATAWYTDAQVAHHNPARVGADWTILVPPADRIRFESTGTGGPDNADAIITVTPMAGKNLADLTHGEVSFLFQVIDSEYSTN